MTIISPRINVLDTTSLQETSTINKNCNFYYQQKLKLTWYRECNSSRSRACQIIRWTINMGTTWRYNKELQSQGEREL